MKTRLFFSVVLSVLIACSLFSPPASQKTASPSDKILTGTEPLATTEIENLPTPTWENILLDSEGDEIATLEPSAREDFPPPSVEPSIPLPPLAEPLSLPAGTVNLLLLGSDERGPFGGKRTDTLLLVSFHPKRGDVSVISFPRDLYVYIPGWTVRRINEAYQYGGFESLADTFDYNFGLRPDYFVTVNFSTFQQSVDSIGGIDVKVTGALAEGDFSVSPGVVHMDGEMALWYVRSRYTTSDFDRMRRQQEVLMAVFQRLISTDGLNKVPQLYKLYEESVETNIGLNQALAWVGVAQRIADDSDTVKSLAIDQFYVTPYRTPGGAQVLLPDRDAILSSLNELLVK